MVSGQAQVATHQTKKNPLKGVAIVVHDSEPPVSAIFMFARNLGATTRKTLNDSEELHKSWLKSSDSGRRMINQEFLIGYITGYLASNREVAETIINGRVRFGAQPTPKKPARTQEQQRAYDAARKMFAFHISRDDRRVRERAAVKQVKLSAQFKEAAVEFVQMFYEEVTVEALDDIIARLKAFRQRFSKIMPELGLND